MLRVAVRRMQKQESASFPTTKTTAIPATPESDLVLQVSLMTTTRVGTRLTLLETLERSTSRPWGTSWCSENLKLQEKSA